MDVYRLSITKMVAQKWFSSITLDKMQIKVLNFSILPVFISLSLQLCITLLIFIEI